MSERPQYFPSNFTCPECGSNLSRVWWIKYKDGEKKIRVRQCSNSHRFNTEEKIISPFASQGFDNFDTLSPS